MLVLVGALTAGCSSASSERVPMADATLGVDVPTSPLATPVRRDLDALFEDAALLSAEPIASLARARDVRVAWPLLDLLRFHQGQTHGPDLYRALRSLTEIRSIDYKRSWVDYTDVLLREDVPAPPGYLRWKRAAFLAVSTGWKPFFVDRSDVDWRLVSWGGALRDGIRSLDDPPMVEANGGGWQPDDDVVFGVAVGDEYRAYPRRVLEVHEIVNDDIGGRRVALSYCTLCGTAIGYATDRVPGADAPFDLRTSGLLQRSNKLMYDTTTESLFDQFRGVAVAGPLRGMKLAREPVSVTTWGEWRRAHPSTLVTPREIEGREYGPDPLGGRDAAGPIFPVGERDPRLPPMRRVLGALGPDGPVAFDVLDARARLRAGDDVEHRNVRVHIREGSLVATSGDKRVVSQESFWFAWSQFHAGTALWRA